MNFYVSEFVQIFLVKFFFVRIVTFKIILKKFAFIELRIPGVIHGLLLKRCTSLHQYHAKIFLIRKSL